MTDSPNLTPRDRALAAWESSAVLSLASLLASEQCDALWSRTLALRAGTIDADTYAAQLRETLTGVPQSARHALDVALANLTAVLASHPE